MELRIDFPKLPENKTLTDMRSDLDAVLADDGWLLASGQTGESGFVELELEDEKQNILRINDILSELEKQLGPLERQSETAKIYLKKKRH